MKTLFGINGRFFTTLEFAKKRADKDGLDYSLITTKDVKEYTYQSRGVFRKENQELYQERRALQD
jgi:hypothetical protein